MENGINELIILSVLESMLKSGLRAVREQQALIGAQTREYPKKERKSNTKIVADVLREVGHPLHIDEIIRIAREEKGIDLHRESIVSALCKKLLEKKVFGRTGRNEFSLLEWEAK